MQKIKIGGMIQYPELSLFRLYLASGQSYSSAALLHALGNANINVQVIIQGTGENDRDLFAFCIDHDDHDKTIQAIESLQFDHNCNLLGIEANVASLGVYGPDFRLHAGLAGEILKTLAGAAIHILAISTSLSTFTVILPAKQLTIAVTAIEELFELP